MTLQIPAGIYQSADRSGELETDEPPSECLDYVSLSDAGEFTYHANAEALLAYYEYPAEAVIIVDRGGMAHSLALDADRVLVFARPHGRVDFPSLRQAWLRAQKLRPQSYPLHRLPPASTLSLLNGLFEALQLEARPARFSLPWTVQSVGAVAHPLSLGAVDRYLAELETLEHVLVQDPFGHRYSPVRHQTHRFLAPAAGFICYVEVPSCHE